MRGKEFERGVSPLSLIYSPFLARKVFRSPSMVLAGKGAGGKVYRNNQMQTATITSGIDTFDSPRLILKAIKNYTNIWYNAPS